MIILPKRCQGAVIGTHWPKDFLISMCTNPISCTQEISVSFIFLSFWNLSMLYKSPYPLSSFAPPFPSFVSSDQVFSMMPLDALHREFISDTRWNPFQIILEIYQYLTSQGGREVLGSRNTWPALMDIIHEKQSESKIRRTELIGRCYRAEHT